MPERRGAVLARLHEAVRELALRQRALVRLAGIRRRTRLCGSGRGLGYGYVTSQMGTTFTGDPRDMALREALYSGLQIS